MSRPPQVHCQNVQFSFGRRLAVRDFTHTFSVGATAVLGPNGAGKSTLLRLIATVARPTRGDIVIDGTSALGGDRERIRRRLGYLPQQFDLMRWSSAHRNVAYAAWAQGVPPQECDEAAEAALARVDLTAEASRRVNSLSGGQQKRVGIACAIAHRPTVILLDEPTAGLDPVQRTGLTEHLAQLAAESLVIFSTHIVDDVGGLAPDVLILNAGETLFAGPLTELEQRGRPLRRTPDESALQAAYLSLLHASAAHPGP